VSLTLREAELGDAEAIAAIHDEAVIAGNATFRSDPRPLHEVEGLLQKGLPFLVAEEGGAVVGWASAGPYEESNPYYAGVREAAVYVAASARGHGAGRALLDRLAERVEGEKVFKLVAKVFTTNEASLRLFERAGYSKVGTHIRHGRLRGEWKDVVVLEKLVGDAADVRALR
jgi:L-amino acid N-acyltransferase YncA